MSPTQTLDAVGENSTGRHVGSFCGVGIGNEELRVLLDWGLPAVMDVDVVAL